MMVDQVRCLGAAIRFACCNFFWRCADKQGFQQVRHEQPCLPHACLPYDIRHAVLLACLAYLSGISLPGWSAALAEAGALDNAGDAYADLSLEQLGSIEVTSVSKKGERLGDAAASIYVISNEAIRRSGASSLPEALRLAPNLQVARINSSQYAISARGFNSSTANKLLVLIDGRTVYTPLYSGVFWDVQDVLLEDVERIEVISGPGGTVWGANAVNGVINIITRPAAASAGNFAAAALGNGAQAVALRHGGAMAGGEEAILNSRREIRGSNGGGGNGDSRSSSDNNYRIYAKLNRYARSMRASGLAQDDGWHHQQAGFRSDWGRDDARFTVQGDVYQSALEQPNLDKQHNRGMNLLARWDRQLDADSSLRTQFYYDRTRREVPGSFTENLDMLDIDLQYALNTSTAQQWLIGGGYRHANDHVDNSAMLAFLPAQRKLHWANLFAQLEHKFDAKLRVNLGGKFEYNDDSGIEFLPSMKLAWKLSDEALLWASLSRAVRAPSRLETDFYLPGTAPFVLIGAPGFRSEIANTLELGWRAQFGETLSCSATVFGSQYRNLRSLDNLPGGVYALGNGLRGHSEGVEAWGTYQASRNWVLSAGLLWQHQRFQGANLYQSVPGNDPRYQLQLGSRLKLGEAKYWDVTLRHVAALPYPAVPAYTTIDSRFGWRISHGIEVALGARNLLNRPYQEFAAGSNVSAANTIQTGRVLDLTVMTRF